VLYCHWDHAQNAILHIVYQHKHINWFVVWSVIYFPMWSINLIKTYIALLLDCHSLWSTHTQYNKLSDGKCWEICVLPLVVYLHSTCAQVVRSDWCAVVFDLRNWTENMFPDVWRCLSWAQVVHVVVVCTFSHAYWKFIVGMWMLGHCCCFLLMVLVIVVACATGLVVYSVAGCSC